MSFIGCFVLFLLIWGIFRLVNDEQKGGVLLFLSYCIMLPLLLFFVPLTIFELGGEHASAASVWILLAALPVSGIVLLVLRFVRKDGRFFKVFTAPCLKRTLCVVVAALFVYLEFFNGIETFPQKTNFFVLKFQIKIGHMVPYRLNCYPGVESGIAADGQTGSGLR